MPFLQAGDFKHPVGGKGRLEGRCWMLAGRLLGLGRYKCCFEVWCENSDQPSHTCGFFTFLSLIIISEDPKRNAMSHKHFGKKQRVNFQGFLFIELTSSLLVMI
jgi:hypothetical protein